MRIRYTIGPDELWLGEVHLHRDEWYLVTSEQADQAMLATRVDEYGFELDTTED